MCVFVSVFFYQISWKADERKEVSIRDSGANLQQRHLKTDFIFFYQYNNSNKDKSTRFLKVLDFFQEELSKFVIL